jgi:hypothetical protein
MLSISIETHLEDIYRDISYRQITHPFTQSNLSMSLHETWVDKRLIEKAAVWHQRLLGILWMSRLYSSLDASTFVLA